MIGRQKPEGRKARAFNESTSAVRMPFGAFANLIVWILIGLFAVMCLFCVVAGAEVYRGTVKNAEINGDLRTAVSYVAGKVRAWDRYGAISVEPWAEGDSLMLTEEIDGEEYTTCIYNWNGGIYEIFALSDSEFTPDGGQRIANGENLKISFIKPSMLEMTITVNGMEYVTHVALRSEPTPATGG